MTRAFCFALCAAAFVRPPLVAGALCLRPRLTGDRSRREARLATDTTVLPTAPANRLEAALRRAPLPALASGAYRGFVASVRREAGDPSPGRSALTAAASSTAVLGLLGAIAPAERWRRVTS